MIAKVIFSKEAVGSDAGGNFFSLYRETSVNNETPNIDSSGDYYPAADYAALEAELEQARADLKLRAESYDANTKGWQEDITNLKTENKRLRDHVSELIDEFGPKANYHLHSRSREVLRKAMEALVSENAAP